MERICPRRAIILLALVLAVLVAGCAAPADTPNITNVVPNLSDVGVPIPVSEQSATGTQTWSDSFDDNLGDALQELEETRTI